MRFPPAFLDEIRERVPISTVVGARVTWDKRKTNAGKGDWWACCPFHGEKSPSFHCEDRKGRYHCFGCDVSGDHFRFLTELDGLSFPEAVERIADLASVPMPARDEQEERREKERSSLTDVMEMATRFYEDRLQSGDGAQARAYLRERGLTLSTQQAFRLGFAPDSRNALREHLAGKRISKEQMDACGLIYSADDAPVAYDRFRGRIMFPIPDSRGRIIAFGGRALSADVAAKYLNSPETELFHKGNVLYNFARARKGLSKGEMIIAVEGYMDVIALAQAGFSNVVAPLGTALTEKQMELLWRLSPEPLLCFDGDHAGLRAAWRAADMILPSAQPGRTARFALLPDGKDPDDMVRGDGPEAFRTVLAAAKPLSDLIWLRETGGGVFDTPERRAELERRMRELTSVIRDESTRFHYQQAMRERVQTFFGTAPRRRQGEVRSTRDHPGRGAGSAKSKAPTPISDSLNRSAMVRKGTDVMTVREATILVSLVNHPQLIEEFFEHVEFLKLANADLSRLHSVLLDAMAHDLAGDRDALIEAILKDGRGDTWQRAEAIIVRARQWPALESAAIADARDAFVQAMHLQHSAHTLHDELRAAEAALANDPTEDNYRQLIEIQTQLRDLGAKEALIEGFGTSSGRADRG